MKSKLSKVIVSFNVFLSILFLFTQIQQTFAGNGEGTTTGDGAPKEQYIQERINFKDLSIYNELVIHYLK